MRKERTMLYELIFDYWDEDDPDKDDTIFMTENIG